VRRALEGLKGVKKAEVSFSEKRATVTYDPGKVSVDDMVQAVAFVASDGRLDKKEKFLKNRLQLEKILERKYHNKHGYSFPFQHFFVITRRML